MFAAGGHPQPINDMKRLDAKRVVLGIIAFGLCIAVSPQSRFKRDYTL